MIFSKKPSKQRETGEMDGRGPFDNALTVQDMFCPDGLVNLYDCLRLGADGWCRVYVIHVLPQSLMIGWLDELIYAGGDVDISVHINPAPDKKVIDELIKLETRQRTQYTLDKRAGNISRLPELEASIADYRALREVVQLGHDRLMYVTIYIAVHAQSEEELRRRRNTLETVLARKNILARALVVRQLEGLKASLPLGLNKIHDHWKNLTTGCAACCLPASTVAVGHNTGILLGFNVTTKAPVLVDRFAGEHVVSNQHMFISGEPGSGKSVTKRLIVLRECELGTRGVLIDPENEDLNMIRKLGGQAIVIRPGVFSGMNLLDIESALEENESGVRKEVVNIQDKIAEIKALIAVVTRQQTGQGLGMRELGVLERAIREEYEERGITSDPGSLYRNGIKKTMPTMSSLYERISSRNEFLADVLTPFLAGNSLGMFDGQTTLQLADAPLIAFGLKNMSVDFTKFFAMYATLSWVWQKFAQKGGRAVKKSVVVDEAWMFMRYPDAADYLEVLARRGRKHGCGLLIATQRFEEFAGSEAGRSVIESCATVLTLKQEEHAVDAVMNYFRLAAGCRELLVAARPGVGILRLSGSVTAVQVSPANFEWPLVDTPR